MEGLSKPLKIRTPHLKALNDYLVTKRGMFDCWSIICYDVYLFV